MWNRRRTDLYSPLGAAPGDLLLEIAACLDTRIDLLNLSLTASGSIFHALAGPDMNSLVQSSLHSHLVPFICECFAELG